MRRALLAMGERNERLAEAITKTYEEKGFEVIRSEAGTREEIQETLARLEQEGRTFDTFLYIPEEVRQLSVLDADFYSRVGAQIDGDLRTGFWWLQEVIRDARKRGIGVSIVLLNHITSIVPTQKFSYCSAGQAALVNLSKVAAIESARMDDGVRINVLVSGWNEDSLEERRFFEDMQVIHEGDPCPVLRMVSPQEIAQGCYGLGEISAATGSMLILDKGYSVTRQIRRVDYYRSDGEAL